MAATKPDTVTITRDGQEVTLTGEELARWKYQRYMQDYLARSVASTTTSAGCSTTSTRRASRRTRSSSTRATRGSSSAITACTTSGSCTRSRCGCRSSSAGRRRSSAGARSDAMALNVDFAPTFLDAAGRARSRRHAGPQPRAAAARQDARRLAHVDVLPLLPRSRPSQHARALRRAHGDAQADLLLEEGPVGAVRPGAGPARAAQPLRPAGAGGADADAEGGAAAARRRR